MDFEIIDIEQGSPEWHTYRNTRVMASDIPTLLGVGYSTPRKLFAQKKDPSLSTFENEAMRRGKELESDAREWAEAQLNITFPAHVVESKQYPMFGASLDGLATDSVLEIKCPGYRVYKEVIELGSIPKNWLYQIQWQLYITGFNTAYLCVYEGFTGKIITVQRDQNLIDRMIPIASAWWKDLMQNNSPAPEEKDYVKVDISLEQFEILSKWREVNALFKDMEKEEKNLCEIIKSWGDDGNCEFAFEERPLASLTRVKRDGLVDWKALCVAKGITENDILPFRKEQIGFYQLRASK